MLTSPGIGQQVRILPPFDKSFPATYTVEEIVTHPDGQIVCLLSQEAGGFDPIYLVAAPDLGEEG